MNLAASDTIKLIKLIKEALDTAFEIIKLIKKSPKREKLLEKIKEECLDTSVGIRHFCPTRWTIKHEALKGIIVNFKFLIQVFEESKVEADSKLKIRLNGVLVAMKKFQFCYGIYLGYKLLKVTDNLAKSLQTKGLTAMEGQQMARNTITVLENLSTDEEFDIFWDEILKNEDIERPSVPRKRQRNARYFEQIDMTTADSAIEHYKPIYFDAIEGLIKCIKDRFNQESYQIFIHLENLILKAAKNEPFEEDLEATLKFYGKDFNAEMLRVQLNDFSQNYSKIPNADKSFQGIVQYFKSLEPGMVSYYSEIYKLLELILVIPASNASSERYFSKLRTIKNYMRSTMGQERLNHCMMTSIYKSELMELNLVEVLNQFVAVCDNRKTFFGLFDGTEI